MTDASTRGNAGLRPSAVTLYRNGSVYTAADPFATAMLVDGDTVAWVGSEQAATSIADTSMEVIDLRGALLAPGFVDSHIHLTETGVALDSLQLGGVRSARELLEAVERAALAAGPVLGHGWDESLWEDPALPAAGELERAAGGRPVYLSRVDAHSALISPSLAAAARLEELDGFAASGHVKRQAHTAARRAARNLPAAALQGYQRRALEEAAANGYVALAEMGSPQIGSVLDLQLAAGWNATTEAGAALPEVLPYWGQLTTSVDDAEALLAELGVPIRGLAGDLNIDGSIGSRTASLREPYADAAGERGVTYLSADEAAAHLAACSLLGIQGGFHVIGDAGLDAALDALEQAAAEVGERRIRAAGHRFEHVEMADAEAIARLAKWSVTVSAQPAFDAAWGGPGRLYEQRLGARSQHLNPFASLYSAGVPVCFGSDSPVTPLRPWATVRACLEHSNPVQRISARAAFLGHTRAGWRAAKHANPMAGQLVPGAPATFAVWDVEELMVQVADGRVQSWSTDPRARTPLLPALDTGSDPRCLQTVRNGLELYSAESLRA